ncbi:ribonuclease H-like domain-containing protein [Bacillus sp. FJAT-49711]|uniref:ribonuclease H-like domain-containing protein n=1 Tax=Bacillus sp. FJAT-49711 TaxID=2833585 RepID=UPI001BC8DB64|nr:ribonuclease H-like domain-containing protein [Bacillus sp. FJAT-49711]MBS4217344.1 ribonuclease H-like domain-containing protein [Bacillus sp. FJAT-49711]
MSLKNKLNRFKAHMNISEHEKEDSSPIEQISILPDSEEWLKAGASPYFHDNQFCYIKEIRYPLDYQHGNYRLKDFLAAFSLWEDFSGRHPLSVKGMSPSDLFFFDTETTGLYGGVGNSIFLLGYARFVGDEFVLRQHFLPEPGFEVALYKSFLENVDYTTLVTYNGKAFDWPQVKTQHTLVRQHVPNLPAFGHFDLYHASRRLWKNKLESVKLARVEEEILGVKRINDIPGYLAPMIYFDYVERKNPEGILEVLKHNEIDILSLITLYTHLTYQIQGVDPKQTPTEKMLIAKWYQYIGERDLAADTFEVAADEGDYFAKHELAFYLKRAGKYDDAREIWLEVITHGEDSIKKDAYIELAKLMEHQYKDYIQALEFTRAAMELHFIKDDRFAKNANKRLARLLGRK